MDVPVDSIRHLMEVFVHEGVAHPQDLPHLSAVNAWLRSQEDDNGKME